MAKKKTAPPTEEQRARVLQLATGYRPAPPTPNPREQLDRQLLMRFVKLIYQIGAELQIYAEGPKP